MLIWSVQIVVTIGIIVAIVQIRNATQRMAKRLDDIYGLLKQQNISNKEHFKTDY